MVCHVNHIHSTLFNKLELTLFKDKISHRIRVRKIDFKRWTTTSAKSATNIFLQVCVIKNVQVQLVFILSCKESRICVGKKFIPTKKFFFFLLWAQYWNSSVKTSELTTQKVFLQSIFSRKLAIPWKETVNEADF